MHATVFFIHVRLHPCSILFPYTTLFRSVSHAVSSIATSLTGEEKKKVLITDFDFPTVGHVWLSHDENYEVRSEEHTSELQSRGHLVCRLLLEKKKKTQQASTSA